MRPDEIRKFDLYSAQDTTEHHIHDCAHLLREIAAQLAEQTEIARTALGDSHNLLAEALAKQEAERNERSQLPPAAESPQIEEPNHLVRVGQTLCGLKKWSGGNIDIDFGLKKGITTCVDCLRAIAIESRKLTKQPTPAAEPLIGLTTDDLVIGQEQEDAEGYQHKDQPAAEPPREKGKHRFLGGTCVDCGRPLDDICTANQQADLPKEQDVVSECAEIIKKLHTADQLSTPSVL
jgi:hypothetical protein